jgi:hypothetical protein
MPMCFAIKRIRSPSPVVTVRKSARVQSKETALKEDERKAAFDAAEDYDSHNEWMRMPITRTMNRLHRARVFTGMDMYPEVLDLSKTVHMERVQLEKATVSTPPFQTLHYPHVPGFTAQRVIMPCKLFFEKERNRIREAKERKANSIMYMKKMMLKKFPISSSKKKKPDSVDMTQSPAMTKLNTVSGSENSLVGATKETVKDEVNMFANQRKTLKRTVVKGNVEEPIRVSSRIRSVDVKPTRDQCKTESPTKSLDTDCRKRKRKSVRPIRFQEFESEMDERPNKAKVDVTKNEGSVAVTRCATKSKPVDVSQGKNSNVGVNKEMANDKNSLAEKPKKTLKKTVVKENVVPSKTSRSVEVISTRVLCKAEQLTQSLDDGCRKRKRVRPSRFLEFDCEMEERPNKAKVNVNKKEHKPKLSMKEYVKAIRKELPRLTNEDPDVVKKELMMANADPMVFKEELAKLAKMEPEVLKKNDPNVDKKVQPKTTALSRKPLEIIENKMEEAIPKKYDVFPTSVTSSRSSRKRTPNVRLSGFEMEEEKPKIVKMMLVEYALIS